jgi:hypothetical protein
MIQKGKAADANGGAEILLQSSKGKKKLFNKGKEQ